MVMEIAQSLDKTLDVWAHLGEVALRTDQHVPLRSNSHGQDSPHLPLPYCSSDSGSIALLELASPDTKRLAYVTSSVLVQDADSTTTLFKPSESCLSTARSGGENEEDFGASCRQLQR
jgi:hypothetical protein